MGTEPSAGDEQNPETGPAPSDSAVRYLTRSKSSVYFARGSAELNDEALATIADHAERLKANPNAAVTLVGFTEDIASRSYSLALAQQRAKVVGDALVGMGVATRQIRAASYAREEPGTAPCTTEICRISYRRVEFRYLKPDDTTSIGAAAGLSRRHAPRRRD